MSDESVSSSESVSVGIASVELEFVDDELEELELLESPPPPPPPPWASVGS